MVEGALQTPSTLGLRLNPINPKGLDDPHWMQYPGPKQTNKQTNKQASDIISGIILGIFSGIVSGIVLGIVIDMIQE